MPNLPVTRATLRRELVVNAATKPLAIGAAAAVAVAALLLGHTWLLGVAVALYLALAVTTLFDPKEAERVGELTYEKARGDRALPQGLAPELRECLRRAQVEQRRIDEALAASDAGLAGVSTEVSNLVQEAGRIARRAQVLRDYLAEQSPEDVRLRLRSFTDQRPATPEATRARDDAAAALQEQLRAIDGVEAERRRFESELEHLIASLAVIHSQIVRMSVDDTVAQDDLAGELQELRDRVGAVAASTRVPDG